jgi:hypothetical protein
VFDLLIKIILPYHIADDFFTAHNA